MKFLINKIQTLSMVFIIIAGLAIAFLIYPTLIDIQTNSDKIAANKEALALADKENAAVSIFKGDYQTYKPNLDKVKQLFIDPSSPIDFIKFLEDATSSNTITLDTNLLTNAKNEISPGVNASTFDLEAKGKFSNILKFLDDLERGPYLVKVQELRIAQLPKELNGGKNNPESVDVKLLIYVANQ